MKNIIVFTAYILIVMFKLDMGALAKETNKLNATIDFLPTCPMQASGAGVTAYINCTPNVTWK